MSSIPDKNFKGFVKDFKRSPMFWLKWLYFLFCMRFIIMDERKRIFAFAVASHESGFRGFPFVNSSLLSQCANNYFGMRPSVSRSFHNGYVIAENNGAFAHYLSPRASILDFVAWQEKYNKHWQNGTYDQMIDGHLSLYLGDPPPRW